MDNPTIEFSETQRGKEQLIVNKKYLYNFSHENKDKSKFYRCTEYKTKFKCNSTIILNKDNSILKYNEWHNHPGKKLDASKSILKHKIKNEIRKNTNPFNLKPRNLYNELSQNMGLICPEYSSVKTQIMRSINRKFPQDINTFDEIPEESEF